MPHCDKCRPKFFDCPYCGELTFFNLAKCPHCGERMTEEDYARGKETWRTRHSEAIAFN